MTSKKVVPIQTPAKCIILLDAAKNDGIVILRPSKLKSEATTDRTLQVNVQYVYIFIV